MKRIALWVYSGWWAGIGLFLQVRDWVLDRLVVLVSRGDGDA